MYWQEINTSLCVLPYNEKKKNQRGFRQIEEQILPPSVVEKILRLKNLGDLPSLSAK